MASLTLRIDGLTFNVDPTRPLNGGVYGSTFGDFLSAVSQGVDAPTIPDDTDSIYVPMKRQFIIYRKLKITRSLRIGPASKVVIL